MRILFLNWNGYGNEDIIDTFEKMKSDGEDIDLLLFSFDIHKDGDSQEFCSNFTEQLKKEKPDFVLSYNYFPIISKACQNADIKYAAWVYDNPSVSLFSYTLINSCNYVFLFDSQMYDMFARQGIKTVYYLPLAAPVSRYEEIIPNDEDRKTWGGNVSFVGNLYNQKGNFYDRIKEKLSDHTRGYLEGIMRAQMEIFGANIIEELLDQNSLKEMVDILGLKPNYDGAETYEYLYSNYVLDRKITSMERDQLIRMVGKYFETVLYTGDESFCAKGIDNRGKIDYYTEMPIVFKSSDINLNITLRSIQKGIPLRAFDIMGCGGFLLTNYQEDMLRFFIPDEDFVFFDSREDLLQKIDYYLKHEDERKKIAENGFRKVQAEHTYTDRLKCIIKTVMGEI